ncbi:MAG: AAA family ATPase [Luteolibacter sp.]
MIVEIEIRNFRGFENHILPLKDLSIIVGANNAGKSTIVEALRFVAVVASRFRNLTYHRPSSFFEEHGAHTGVRPSLKNLEFSFKNIFHRYGEAPATISARFSNRSRIDVYLSEDEIFASITDQNGAPVRNKVKARDAEIPLIAIMPQVEPVREREQERDADYIRGAVGSRLSSAHFRNQLHLFKEDWPKLQEALSSTWPGVRLEELIRENQFPPHFLNVEVRVDDFVSELSTLGHGLQMWMQTMWFLCRSSESDVVILDEPDVYMHADLQRRLIRYVKSRYPQVIIATHSIEIMSEVEATSILVTDRKRPRSAFATSIPAVQKLVGRIGSIHNLNLARLWKARCLILVEGDDLKFLKIVQDTLFPESQTPFDVLPNISIGGWSGWHYAVGSNMAMRNSVGESLRTYCIFDSDFHTFQEIEDRYSDAKDKSVDLHIWKRKEIENYAILPKTISRFIEARSTGQKPSPDGVEERIIAFADELKDECIDALATEHFFQCRSLGIAGGNKAARERIKEARESDGSLANLVSGKLLISMLSRWSQSEFGVSFNASNLFREMRPDEIPEELKEIVTRLESRHPLLSTYNKRIQETG